MDRVNNFYVKDLLIFSIKKQVLYSPSQSSKRTKINFEREKYSFYAEAEKKYPIFDTKTLHEYTNDWNLLKKISPLNCVEVILCFITIWR